MRATLKELKVWQESVLLAAETVRSVRPGSRHEIKALTERIVQVAIEIPARIADGHGRYTASEQRHCYRSARRALLSLDTHLAVARHAEVISSSLLSQLSSRAGNVARLLAGYLAFIERQLAEEQVAARSVPSAQAAPVLSTSLPAAPPSLRKPLDEVDGAQARERSGSGADQAVRGAREM